MSFDAPMRVALYLPCYVDQFYPQVGVASLELLERLGVEVVYPEKQTCCGQPLVNSGAVKEAQKIAEHFLRVFQDYEYIVCPSGSCTAMVTHHYDSFFPADSNYHQLKTRVFELCADTI